MSTVLTKPHQIPIKQLNVQTVTSNYQPTLMDDVILCDGTLIVTLPTAVNIKGKTFSFKNVGNGNITINAATNETIDGASSYEITTKYNSFNLVSDNNNWYII